MGDKYKGKGGWSEDDEEFSENPFAAAFGGPSEEDHDEDADSMAETVELRLEDIAPDRVHIRMERKGRGGKTVTVLEKMNLLPNLLSIFCTALRKDLGVGGSVEGSTIVLQGDQRDRLEEVLEARGVERITRG